MTPRDLKEYIVKLNDRNIQRQRETGFTEYAILGSIIFCFFYLIDNLSILSKITENTNLLNIVTLSSNSLFILFLFYGSFVSATRRLKKTIIFPLQESLTIGPEDFIFLSIMIFISSTNFLYLKYCQNDLHCIYLYVFGILTILNFAFPFIVKIFKFFKHRRKRKKGYSIENLNFTFFNKTLTNIISIASFGYGTILLIFSVIVISKLNLNIQDPSISSTIKYVVMFYGLLFLIQKTINININRNDNDELEELEKDIYFENISNEEIALKFERDFSGIPFTKWITTKRIEIIVFFETKKKELLNIDILLLQLDKINKSILPHEYNGRFSDIIFKKNTIFNQADDFIQIINNHFTNLKAFASLNNEEVKSLIEVQKELNNNIHAFNDTNSDIYKKIEARQSK